jgi:geranylgeranyl reductase family protein
MKYDAVIVGAGPGGLHCATILAQGGVRTAVLERNRRIGQKVCAGGITGGGLVQEIPDRLIQKAFYKQTISTPLQTNMLRKSEPMVATVNRQELGLFMAEKARNAGVDLYTGTLVEHIDAGVVHYRAQGRTDRLHYDYLVGADGTHSKVRSYLGTGQAAPFMGVAMHYLVEHSSDEMVWNFNPWSFGSGYSWIFPHRGRVSAGAYLADGSIIPLQLKKNLDHWLAGQNIDTKKARFEAAKIHIGFNGWSFGNCFLVGDAAGLASPLTGEGISPAFISAQAAALTILEESYISDKLEKLIARHRKHRFLVKAAGRSRLLSLILAEICSTLLRFRLISFKKFEMA